MTGDGDHDGPGGALRRRPRLLAAVFGVLAALLLVLLVVLVQRASHARDAAIARKQHSYDVMILASEVDGSLARAEAALGRYVIDSNPRTGTIYYDEWQRAGREIADLADLVADDPVQARRAAALQRLYDRRAGELGRPATLILYKRQWQALSFFARAGKSPVLPAITRLLRAIDDHERDLLRERATAAEDTLNLSNFYVRLLSLVGALLTLSAVAAGWLAVAALAERRAAREQAEAEVDRTAALERAVAERTLELSAANQRLREEAEVRAQAEAKLRQVQKMEAVGQLTGGIAHDFNNMLAVVLGGLELARRRVAQQGSEAQRHIDNAMEGANRAAALTRRLLSFARAEPLLPVATDPGQLIVGMSDLIDRTIGERIEVRTDCAPGVWPVWVDPYQLENAILNLCVNARDAMGGAGLLEMKAANVGLAKNEAGTLEPGDYVAIAVRDNGKGMSPDILERVFEPFFTTKPAGEGTGLGLSQIFGFARQSGGDVVIDSIEGVGTTVTLYLPRHRGAVRPAPTPSADELPPASTSGTILVVEDDDRVRASSGAALVELGYRPALCASAEEAIERLGQLPDVRLLITDVVMPGITGPELVARVGPRFPRLPVLFVTGYVGEAGESESFSGHLVLRKPFTLRALADAIASALAGNAGPAHEAA